MHDYEPLGLSAESRPLKMHYTRAPSGVVLSGVILPSYIDRVPSFYYSLKTSSWLANANMATFHHS